MQLVRGNKESHYNKFAEDIYGLAVTVIICHYWHINTQPSKVLSAETEVQQLNQDKKTFF